MSDFVSMLVPLDALPGWPVVEPPSPLLILLLAVGIPVAFTAVVILITMAPSWGRAGKAFANLDEPLWLGAGAQPKALPTGADKTRIVGGASERW